MRLPRTGRGGSCTVHGYHWPVPAGTEVHHVWPLGMGGPDEAWNKRDVCPTGHTNIHTYMAWILWSNGELVRATPLIKPIVTRMERDLAVQGVGLWRGSGRPGNPHAAYGLHVP